MTGLPFVETRGNDVSAYIPTNVISITDGQIFLESDLFNANVRPAINVGISVSRVGGSAQTKAMRKVSGSLRVDLAQFRALEAFAMFASDLDPASRAQLARGSRLVELLKQRQYTPYPMEEQVISIFAGTSGLIDDLPVEDVRRFESELLEHLRREGDILATIRETREFGEDTEKSVRSRDRGVQAQLRRRRVVLAVRRARPRVGRADGRRGRRPGAHRPAAARLRRADRWPASCGSTATASAR